MATTRSQTLTVLPAELLRIIINQLPGSQRFELRRTCQAARWASDSTLSTLSVAYGAPEDLISRLIPRFSHLISFSCITFTPTVAHALRSCVGLSVVELQVIADFESRLGKSARLETVKRLKVLNDFDDEVPPPQFWTCFPNIDYLKTMAAPAALLVSFPEAYAPSLKFASFAPFEEDGLEAMDLNLFLQRFPSIETLHLPDMYDEWEYLLDADTMQTYPHVRELKSPCEMSIGDVLLCLSRFPSLQRLRVPVCLDSLPHEIDVNILTEIVPSNARITGSFPNVVQAVLESPFQIEHLSHMLTSRLEHLILNRLSIYRLVPVLQEFPHLKHVTLDEVRAATQSVLCLNTYHNGLESLTITDMSGSRNAAHLSDIVALIESVVQYCPNLRTLIVRDTPTDEDEYHSTSEDEPHAEPTMTESLSPKTCVSRILQAIIRHPHAWDRLELPACTLFGVSTVPTPLLLSLASAIGSCLSSLELCVEPTFDTVALKSVSKVCPNLESLELGPVTVVKDDALLTLAQNCPHLRVARVNSKLTTKKGIKSMIRRLHWCAEE